MSGKKLLTTILLLVIILLTGCGKPHDVALTGVIEHSHTMTFPVGTVVSVQILDTTKDGSPGKQIAEDVIKDQEIAIPMPFMVIYDQGKINRNHAYSVIVRIEDSTGKLLYANATGVPVITKGNPTYDINVSVALVSGQQSTK